MKRYIQWISVIGGLIFACQLFAAPVINAQQEQVVRFLKEAVQYVQTNGKEASLKEFRKVGGIFDRRTQENNHYLFAFSDDGVCLADITLPEQLGKSCLDFKDVHGNYPLREMCAKAKTGGGWVYYYFKNPKTDRVEPKATYVMPVVIDGKSQGWWIGSGYYFLEHAQ